MTTAKKTPVRKRAATKPEPSAEPVKQFGIDWRSLYLYAVCLITLMVCLFSLAAAIRSGIDIAYPDPAYIDPYAEVPKFSAEAAARMEDQNRRQAVKSLVDSFTTLIIAAPLYLYHWRLARK